MAGAHPDTPGHKFSWSDFVIQRLPLESGVYLKSVFWYDETEGPSVPHYDFPRFSLGAGNASWISADNNIPVRKMFDPIADMGHDDSHPFVVVIVFDDPTDLTGYYLNCDGGTLDALSVSKDTTDGTDGTWDNVVPTPVVDYGGLATSVDYREGAQAWPDPTPNGVSAIRFRHSGEGEPGAINKIHLYGDQSTVDGLTWVANNHRLAFWHPTLNARVDGSWFDLGDVPRGGSRDIKFRIKNLSPTRTATEVMGCWQSNAYIDFTDYAGTDFELADYLSYFSIDGLLFQPAGTLPNGHGVTLGPQAISQVMTLRVVCPTDAPLGNWLVRFQALCNECGDDWDSDTLVQLGDEFGYYGDISTNVPTPHIWFIKPGSGREGDTTFVFGHGFGDDATMYNGGVEYSGTPMFTGAWARVPGIIGSTRSIDTQAVVFENVEHEVIVATIPTSVDDGLITVVTDA